MRQFNMHDAKTNLPELVRLALEGEEIVLARNGKPLVRLIPVAADAGLRPIGLNALSEQEVTEEFMAESLNPLDPEDVKDWHAPPSQTSNDSCAAAGDSACKPRPGIPVNP